MSTDTARPLITFAVMAYNQERFIREAVEGAFAQTYSPLEIILSDDCSQDGTFEIMQEMVRSYRGPHRVVLNRNRANLGICPHVSAIMELARGELIVVAAGDDISLPNRTEATYAVWAGFSRPDYLFFGREVFSEDGSATKWFIFNFNPETATPLGMIRNRGMTLTGASEAWHRRLFDIFGPLPPGVMNEDKSIAFRAALLGGVVYTSHPLVRYRIHGGNISIDQRHDRLGRHRARARVLHWQQALLQGFAHDLETAIHRGLLDEGQAAVLRGEIEAVSARVQWRLLSLEGGILARVRAGLALAAANEPGARRTLRQRVWLLRRALLAK